MSHGFPAGNPGWQVFRPSRTAILAEITAKSAESRPEYLPILSPEMAPREIGVSVPGASKTIRETLTRWPHVTAHPHRFGGTEYRIGSREIGHIHGDWLVDIPFPTKVRNEIVAAGRAEPHHILPDSGWISFYLREEHDVEKAIALFHESYEIAMKQKSK